MHGGLEIVACTQAVVLGRERVRGQGGKPALGRSGGRGALSTGHLRLDCGSSGGSRSLGHLPRECRSAGSRTDGWEQFAEGTEVVGREPTPITGIQTHSACGDACALGK